ncbi:MAG: hypothetical protein SNJ78_12295 [Spirochaetales bacterium]
MDTALEEEEKINFPFKEYQAQIESFHQLMLENQDISDVKLGEDKGTLKEMVGHLIDSASNNHQRFMRLQLVDTLTFPPYDAEEWRKVSQVADLDYRFLATFWKQYNAFLLHLIQHMDPATLDHCWVVKEERKPLNFLVKDYFRHLSWHVDLFKQRVQEIRSTAA